MVGSAHPTAATLARLKLGSFFLEISLVQRQTLHVLVVDRLFVFAGFFDGDRGTVDG